MWAQAKVPKLIKKMEPLHLLKHILESASMTHVSLYFLLITREKLFLAKNKVINFRDILTQVGSYTVFFFFS